MLIFKAFTELITLLARNIFWHSTNQGQRMKVKTHIALHSFCIFYQLLPVLGSFISELQIFPPSCCSLIPLPLSLPVSHPKQGQRTRNPLT